MLCILVDLFCALPVKLELLPGCFVSIASRGMGGCLVCLPAVIVTYRTFRRHRHHRYCIFLLAPFRKVVLRLIALWFQHHNIIRVKYSINNIVPYRTVS